jgi:cell division protein FtsW
VSTTFRPRQSPPTSSRASEGASRHRHPTGRPSTPRGRGPGGRRTNVFLALLGIVTVLVLLGLVMVLSASMVSDLSEHGTAWYSFRRQAAWAVVGVIALVVAMRVPYPTWRRFALPALVGCFVLLVLVLVPGVGLTRGGATRWLGAGGFVVQPAELMKLALVVWIADLLDRRSDRMHVSRATFRPVIVVLGAISVLLLLQPNQGTLAIIAVMAFVMLFAGGTSVLRLGAWMGAAIVGALVLSTFVSYRRDRLLAFLDPWADSGGIGYQTVQSTVGIGSGGLFGVGLGESRAKWGFLPEANTDFIYSIVAEELGLIGAFAVLALFAGLAVVGMVIARNARDRFGMLLASGITAWFTFQAIVNIGAATGSMPVTGVPLPFVSSGGSSLLVTMAAVGILLNIARYTDAPGGGRGDDDVQSTDPDPRPGRARRRPTRPPAARPRRATPTRTRQVSSRHPAAPVS